MINLQLWYHIASSESKYNRSRRPHTIVLAVVALDLDLDRDLDRLFSFGSYLYCLLSSQAFSDGGLPPASAKQGEWKISPFNALYVVIAPT